MTRPSSFHPDLSLARSTLHTGYEPNWNQNFDLGSMDFNSDSFASVAKLLAELFADVAGLLDEILQFDQTSRDENFAPLQPTHLEPSFGLCGSCSSHHAGIFASSED